MTPILYMRSGRRYLWEFARQNTKHITDIDICHLTNEKFEKWKGGRYGGNGGICHYAANLYSAGPDHHLRFMCYDYYLNGTLRTREVAEEYSDSQNDWERLELDGGCPEEDEAWCLYFLEPMAAFVRFEGVPGQLASAPAELFVPNREAPTPRVQSAPKGEEVTYVDAGLPWGGMAAAMPPGADIHIASPTGEPLLDQTEGTVEFWVRDLRKNIDLNNRVLLRCGGLLFLRRMCIGTYFHINGASFQTGFVLPQDRWVHLAGTWKLTENGESELSLYADGVRVRIEHSQPRKIPQDWASEVLELPSDSSGLLLGGLRVSDIARYEDDFERPASPFAHDEHTTVLCNFNGDGKAVVFGRDVTLD